MLGGKSSVEVKWVNCAAKARVVIGMTRSGPGVGCGVCVFLN